MRRESQREKRQAPNGKTLLDRLAGWRALAVFALVCAASAGAWFWLKPRERHVDPAAMRIATDEFPPEYIAQEGSSLSSLAYPQQNLPNMKYDPPRCAEFATAKPFEELGDGRFSYGVQRGADELRTLAFGVVDRTVPWDQFVEFARSCSTFSMTNDFGSGTISIAPQPWPGSAAEQTVSYFLTTHSAKKGSAGAKNGAAKDSSMLIVLSHACGRTVFGGLTVQALKPTPLERMPDREVLTKLYATLARRVEDNS